MPLSKTKVECLLLLLTFEIYWAYYLQSNGSLLSSECRETALQFVDTFKVAAKKDKALWDLHGNDPTSVEDIISAIEVWAKSSMRYPLESAFMSRMMLWVHLTQIKTYLIKSCDLSSVPKMMVTSEEFRHSEQELRWKAHLPLLALKSEPDVNIDAASRTHSIVVIGDIRRSQDIMTYAATPQDYIERITRFLSTTRKLIRDHLGIFDKFTGDGFVAYFNEFICNLKKLDYRSCYLNFLTDLNDFAISHFDDWIQTLRKLPQGGIGLAIGSDLGIIKFDILDEHFIAISDTIVWASRMASIADAGEIVVNNLLANSLKTLGSVHLQERRGTTKTGEEFTSMTLSLAPA